MFHVVAAAGMVLLLAVPLQDQKEDNAWLRYKPGTWLKSKMTIEAGGQTREDIQKLTLQEVDGDDYVIEESYAAPGSKSSQSRRSRGVKSGTETITIDGKEYKCGVFTVKGTNAQGETLAKFWNPEGSKNAVKVVFKQRDAEGELLATAVDVKVSALGGTYTCNKLEGKIKFGDSEGFGKAVLCEDIPGAQIRAEFVIKNPDGEVKVLFEALEIHEIKK